MFQTQIIENKPRGGDFGNKVFGLLREANSGQAEKQEKKRV
jgi:hypothetical protein